MTGDKALRILIVEDNLEDFEILRILFSKIRHSRYELENVRSLSDALVKLRQKKHDVYLVDYKLGADSGIDFLRYAIEQEKCEAPIILLTGYGDYDLDVEAMRIGAADFLNKNKLDPDFMERSIRYALDRKKAEGAHSQLAAILQQSAVAIVGFNLEGRVTTWNQGAVTMFDYDFDEMKGQLAISLVHGGELAETRKLWNKTIEEGQVTNHEETWMKKSGEPIPVSITLTPIRNAAGKTDGISLIARDITYRKQVQAAMQKQEEQMHRAQKLDAVGRLAGGVAHDFNNLLSVIGGNIEFFLETSGKQYPPSEELMAAQKAVRQGAELTKQLLVFGKKQISQPQAVNLNDISRDMNKMFKRLIDASINLTMKQGKDLSFIQADPGQIQQVLLNLVLNARDAMPRGGNLEIDTKNVDIGEFEDGREDYVPPGPYVQLTVTDTGTGMTPEIQKQIFEPFFTTKSDKGTGLGLASVYAIVNKWDGAIFVHSTVGMGTTFCVLFPARLDVETAESQLKPEARNRTGSETLLVAEDEEGVREILVKSLEKRGYKVLEAGDGNEAAQKALDYKDRIDLLLTDTIMPGMNGKELADVLKSSRPELKVVFISGYAADVLSQKGILDSRINLIQKPFELDYLAQELRKILDEK